jgi:hypothetical protein
MVSAAAESSLDEACGIREFVTPIFPYCVALHTGYLLSITLIMQMVGKKNLPTLLGWIGNGSSENSCLLHNPHYDFNDEILPVGAAY